MVQGFQYIKEKLQHMPKEAGCYLMKDYDGNIFYVGKAKNLKARIKSYFLGTDTRIFVQFLEHILAEIETLVVSNDLEALLLERELIKKYQPRFNILLKDDKNYILLKLKNAKKSGSKKELYPRLEIVRKAKKDDARYFGPYPSANQLRTTLELINKYFLLRTCTDQIIANRARPCIQYQIGRCKAPCVFDVPEYSQEVEDVALFLGGNSHAITKRLNEKMTMLAELEQFERAAKVRDQLKAIDVSLTKQVMTDVNTWKNQDIIGFARMGPEIEIVKIHIRNGTWYHSHNYAFSDQPFPNEEILRAFMHQAYANIDKAGMPEEIILPFNIKDELLGLRHLLEKACGHRIHFISPQRSKRQKLLDIANKNAKNALRERIEQNNANIKALHSLKERLGLGLAPKRIECMDISLIQGTNPVGSCVVFIDGQPDKTKYRKYNIKTVAGMDDFAMLHEVVLRRLKHANEDGSMPDLLLIDGGKGQLNAALKAINELEILVSRSGFFVAGIAKARTLKEKSSLSPELVSHSDERLFLPGENEPLLLKAHTFERYLVERIRDEAHRFALSAHKNKRSKRTITSELLSIPGVGKKRALMLLKHFGSVKNIQNASFDELCALEGLGKKAAQKIIEWFSSSKPSAI